MLQVLKSFKKCININYLGLVHKELAPFFSKRLSTITKHHNKFPMNAMSISFSPLIHFNKKSRKIPDTMKI